VKPGALALLLLVLGAPTAEELWPKLPRPQPGEWRWRHAEQPQTLAQYRAADPTRATETRRVVCILPAWTRPGVEAAGMERTEALLAAYFGLPVRRLAARSLPLEAYDLPRRRYDVRALVPFLRRTLPDDAVFLLALTDRSLRLPGARITDGWGSLDLRVGICSTSRLMGDREPARRRRRYLGLVLHEATHMLSLPHCTERACLMNGVMDWKESDGRPLLLCWECRGKVCWNLGLKADARYAELARAWEEAGVPEAVEMIGKARRIDADR
jgi:archaemetzincin